MKKRFPALLVALSLTLPLPSMAAVIWNPESYEEYVAMLQNEEFYHIYDTVDTEFCTVIHYQRIGVPHIVAPQTAIFYKAGSPQGDGAAVYLPLDPESIRLSEDGKQIICTAPFDPDRGTEINTVDLTTGETIKTEHIPPTQEEIIDKWFIPEGGSSTLETRLEAPDCSVVLFWDEALGKRETFVRSYSLYLFYRDPESRKPAAGYQRLTLPSTVYQDIYYPTDRAPDELFLNADGSVLTYVYRFDEALYDLGGNELHGAGTYTYQVDTATGELTVEHTPLLATAGETGTAFSDVSPDDWFAPYVEVCVEAGLMEGVGGGRFDPQGTVSHAQAATLAARLHHIQNGGDGNLPAAPEDWGLLTIEFENGTALTFDSTEYYSAMIPMSSDLGIAVAGEKLAAMDWLGSGESTPALVTAELAQPEEKVPCLAVWWKEGQSGRLRLYPRNGASEEDQAALDRAKAITRSQHPPAGTWYRDTAYYLESVGKTFFLPQVTDSPASRKSLIERLREAGGGLLEPINDISDFSDSDSETKETVLAFYRAGVLTGKGVYGRFDGGATLTRGECAAICARILRPELRVKFQLEPLPEKYPYTLTYLMDDPIQWHTVRYPILPLITETGENNGILTLNGDLLPFPGGEPPVNMEPQGDYYHMSFWFTQPDGSKVEKGGLIDGTGTFVVPLAAGCYRSRPTAEGYLSQLGGEDGEVFLWDREGNSTSLGHRNWWSLEEEYPSPAAETWEQVRSQGAVYADCSLTPLGHPITQTFDWTGNLNGEGAGFVGLAGKIYRIQFTKDPSAET